jgi:hypothetical protein
MGLVHGSISGPQRRPEPVRVSPRGGSALDGGVADAAAMSGMTTNIVTAQSICGERPGPVIDDHEHERRNI